MTLNAVFRQALRATLEELPGTCEDREMVTVQSGTAVAELRLRKRLQRQSALWEAPQGRVSSAQIGAYPGFQEKGLHVQRPQLTNLPVGTHQI